MGPPGEGSLKLIVYSLRLISWLFADNLQISCDFLGGFEKKRIFAAEVLNIEGVDYEKYESNVGGGYR